ncbi:hypothetical protein UK99_15805 [Frankia casuarinae]|uniref:hypothetical protein n=1 Tax=Frankia TaxID=1854 RepID=UPI0004DD0C93|nr:MULTISPECIES: hypothetical protein [Frankia]KEZ37349.1 hypothetical protein CEDDRAFT_01300 [Frankia sp. CeD]OFB43665.1 hypothetical protein Manayef4_11585 [Frankia sp. CgIM4]ORT94597.1 hypothetical protein UK99_15805 [Frankia casuarinae]
MLSDGRQRLVHVFGVELDRVELDRVELVCVPQAQPFQAFVVFRMAGVAEDLDELADAGC